MCVIHELSYPFPQFSISVLIFQHSSWRIPYHLRSEGKIRTPGWDWLTHKSIRWDKQKHFRLQKELPAMVTLCVSLYKLCLLP